MMLHRLRLPGLFGFGLFCMALTSPLQAQAPAAAPAVRPIPPPGLEVSEEVINGLKAKLATLDGKIAQLQKRRDVKTHRMLPDVQIFSIAVQRAIDGKTFFGEKDPDHAVELLNVGISRADELMKGTHSWTKKSGLIPRGYVSKIDGSVQPYGVVIGKDWQPESSKPVRCDIWFRGRSEKGLELQFLYDRLHYGGEYQLDNAIVLHPFGRYCNANRFAGEVDVLEALEHAKSFYKIDDDRISVRGFSMGGAACWGFTVHYPSRWFASNPGAGFSETRQFLGLDKKPEAMPAPFAQQLWKLYDADVLADNLFDVNVIAYSGEIDGQKRAADIMVEAAGKRGLQFPYVIGPQTGHKIHPDSKKIIAEQLDEWAKAGRSHERKSVRFCTFSLKYNNCDWITLNRLGEHWQEAYVDGDVVGDWGSARELKFKTRNTTDFSVDFAESTAPFSRSAELTVTIDGQEVKGVKSKPDGRLLANFEKQNDTWSFVKAKSPASSRLVKRHDLQGPVDDALMSSFIFVEPTGEFLNPAVKDWVQSEQSRAAREWAGQMRGIARTKKDTEVTPDDIKNHNLILWGCPQSNRVLKKISEDLPIKWTAEAVTAGDKKFDSAGHVLIAIYPNPLNPDRYIVLNSGLTYREADYLNNAMQTPKLPDWAVIDLSQPPSAYAPGKIVGADFFNEEWQLKPAR